MFGSTNLKSVFALALLVALTAALIATPAQAGQASSSTSGKFAAIAFSQSTGQTGYSYNCGSRAEAETLALSYCNASDARIIVWVKNGYCALALGNDLGAYGVAWASSAAEARILALGEARKVTTGVYIAVTVFSGY
jgi:serine/threonine-protein kinase